MELKEQRYVVTLADCENLTRAAEQLFISQPALSIYISNLEKNIGLPLFNREGKKFIPTLAGERYIHYARKILKDGAAFDKEVASMLSDEKGRIRFGISLLRGNWLLPTVIKKFSEKWPDIELLIRQGNITFLNELLREHDIDMLLVNEEDMDPHMEKSVLFEEEFLVAVPQGHPLNGKAVFKEGYPYGILSPQDLNGQVFLSTTDTQSSRALQDHIMEEYNIVPDKVEVIRSIQLNLQLVAEGMGICMVREGYTKFLRYNKPINFYMLDIPHHRSKVVIAYQHRNVIPQYMKDFVQMLRERGKEIMNGRL